jgi:hypothetical protein
VTHERVSLLAGSTPRVVQPHEGTILGSAKGFAVDLRSRATRRLARPVPDSWPRMRVSADAVAQSEQELDFILFGVQLSRH